MAYTLAPCYLRQIVDALMLRAHGDERPHGRPGVSAPLRNRPQELTSCRTDIPHIWEQAARDALNPPACDPPGCPSVRRCAASRTTVGYSCAESLQHSAANASDTGGDMGNPRRRRICQGVEGVAPLHHEDSSQEVPDGGARGLMYI